MNISLVLTMYWALCRYFIYTLLFSHYSNFMRLILYCMITVLTSSRKMYYLNNCYLFCKWDDICKRFVMMYNTSELHVWTCAHTHTNIQTHTYISAEPIFWVAQTPQTHHLKTLAPVLSFSILVIHITIHQPTQANNLRHILIHLIWIAPTMCHTLL